MSQGARIVIIDDEEGIRESLRGILADDEGHETLEAASAEEGLRLIEKAAPDAVFLDIWLPGMDGLKALERIRALDPALPVVMISGHGTIETAVAAIRLGAHDFIEKPLSLEKVVLAANKALEVARLRRENRELKSRLAGGAADLTGASPALAAVRGQIEQVAPTDAWVLITGENGTGKEIAARCLHERSRRRERPLVAVNCAAIPEELIESELFGHEKGAFTGADAAKIGRFETASKGTLFLDEIADMSLKTQAKILRILQEQSFERVGGSKTITVDVRVIAATNKNLEEEIAAGRFREDLYYRLKVFPIHLPPLRERGEDIFLLADEFQRTLAAEQGFSPLRFTGGAKERLMAYAWPGNVRELKNFMERMLILYGGREVDEAMLPGELAGRARDAGVCQESDIPPGPVDFKLARQEFETRFLAVKLRECGNNISRLAECVGIERSTLSRKLKAIGLTSEGD